MMSHHSSTEAARSTNETNSEAGWWNFLFPQVWIHRWTLGSPVSVLVVWWWFSSPLSLLLSFLSSLSSPLLLLLFFLSSSPLSSLLFSPLPSPCNCCCLNKVTLNCLFLRSWISDKLWEWQPGVWKDPPWLGPSVNLLPAPIFASSRVQNGGGEIFFLSFVAVWLVIQSFNQDK